MIFQVGGLIGEVDLNESLSVTGGRPGEKNAAENWKVLHSIAAINSRISKKIDFKPAAGEIEPFCQSKSGLCVGNRACHC